MVRAGRIPELWGAGVPEDGLLCLRQSEAGLEPALPAVLRRLRRTGRAVLAAWSWR